MRKRKNINQDILNYDLDENLPFAVIRDDGKLIHQFINFNDASAFCSKLNHSYEDNGIRASSKVIKTSVLHNIN